MKYNNSIYNSLVILCNFIMMVIHLINAANYRKLMNITYNSGDDSTYIRIMCDTYNITHILF